jgi:hypothetical protein
MSFSPHTLCRAQIRVKWIRCVDKVYGGEGLSEVTWEGDERGWACVGSNRAQELG